MSWFIPCESQCHWRRVAPIPMNNSWLILMFKKTRDLRSTDMMDAQDRKAHRCWKPWNPGGASWPEESGLPGGWTASLDRPKTAILFFPETSFEFPAYSRRLNSANQRKEWLPLLSSFLDSSNSMVMASQLQTWKLLKIPFFHPHKLSHKHVYTPRNLLKSPQPFPAC